MGGPEIIYHNPRNELFVSDSDLVKSFIYSRPRNNGIHLSSFESNAGVVALYKVDGSKINKEYHEISKPFFIGGTYTSYGHTERMLMRKVLDELAKLCNYPDLIGPSSRLTPLNEEPDEFQILKNLVDPKIAKDYRSDLDRNGIIVKMWSERKPCVSCEEFLRNICPERSEIRYIVAEYPNSTASVKEVQAAFTDLENAYQQFLARQQD